MCNLIGDSFQIETVVLRTLLIHIFANVQGSFQRLFHGQIEPERHAGSYELDRKEKKKDGRNQGKAGKRHHKLGSQLGPHDLSLSVVEKLHHVSKDKKNQQQQHKHVDVDEDEHDNRIGDRQACSKADDPAFCIEQEANHHEKKQHDDSFTLAAFDFFF